MHKLCSAGGLALLAILAGSVPTLALTQDEISNYKGADRQKMLEEGAKKEGEVSWYATFNVELAVTPLGEAFEKKYPFLKVNFIRATSSQAIQRAQAEFRARSVRVDVMAAGSTDSLSGSGLLQPYWSPILAEYPAPYVDPNREWVADWAGYNGIAWNTNLVKPEEAPKTWEDLANLDPKFKGKIVWGASPTAGAPRVITHWRQMWGEEKALAFIKKFAALDVRTSLGSTDNMLDQMAVGEYAFVVGGAVQLAARRKADGAAVDGRLLDPAIVRTSAIGLLTGSWTSCCRRRARPSCGTASTSRRIPASIRCRSWRWPCRGSTTSRNCR
jgi:ABC-type Fe3+ transport system substrate-binding protein